ncbi:MAG: TolC family protein, partial [Candidatus Zixiibacteriota bacterium]
RKRLKSFLGIDLSETVVLVESDADTSLTGLPPLAVLTDTALRQRPELQGAELLTEITGKAVRVAKGAFFPSFEAVSNYRWESVSDDFTLSGNRTESWTAGLTVSIPIFSGGERIGELRRRQAEHHQSQYEAARIKDDVRLEVEEAYDQLLQAKEALNVQKETIAQAEEGLRIADLRFATGVGTLLEVLSAQAALTSARTNEAEALFAFRAARSQLKKATGVDWK